MAKTFDPLKVIVTVDGIPLTGWADGKFISIKPAAAAFTKKVGASGEVARAKSNDLTQEVVLDFIQTSMSNDILSGFAALDKNNGGGQFALSVIEIGTANVLFATNAWVRQDPDWERSKEIGEVSWTLDTDQAVRFTGGIPA